MRGESAPNEFAGNEAGPHYFVITVGSSGDVHPFMGIASALQRLGRNVTFITHSYHAGLVQAAGLPFVGIGTDQDYLRLLANPDLWDPKKAFSAFMANYRDLLLQIDEAIRSVPAPGGKVAIVHPFAVPGASISRDCGFLDSVVAAYLAPSNLRTCHDPLTIGPTPVPRWVPMSWRRALWRFVEKAWIDPVAVAQINAARESKGLSRVDALLTHIAEAPDLSVTLFPSWFAPPVPDWPVPLITGDFPLFETGAPEALPEELTAFLAGGERPLVFTPGTANIHAARYFACARSAVETLGRRAIFLTRERSQVPAQLPASILWLPYVTLSALLPHAAALVHHGGIGTTAEALRAGTPQMVTPFAWDQFDNGARVTALGAGTVIPVARLKARKLARALSALTASDVIRGRCAQLSKHFIPAHDPIALCREIDHLVRSSTRSEGALAGLLRPVDMPAKYMATDVR